MEAPIMYGHYFGVHTTPALQHEPKRVCKQTDLDAVEPFMVDDLLDFSNEEIAGPIEEEKDQLSSLSADSSITMAEKESCNSTSDKTRAQNPNSLNEEDFCVPCDEMAELEWLSTFVEDSFSADEALKPVYNSALLALKTDNRSELSGNSKDQRHAHSSLCRSDSSGTSERSETTVPGRARSKRSRTGVRVWSSRLDLSSTSGSSLECMSASSNSTSFPRFLSLDCPTLSSETEFLTPEEWGDDCGPIPKKTAKTSRKKAGQDASQPRRCTHCLTQRTPQWRAGPAGPKTLCNACGVRFKSGRLLPEYRPALSPTFVSHQHSNSHRKVLEMRKQKEMSQQREQQEQ